MADITTVEGMMNQFWLVMLSDEKNKQGCGIRYLSHMWDKGPYWYIWLTECQGVYKLELSSATDGLSNYDWVAEFNVKYYPHPDEEWFQGLSVFEQICRHSEVFDNQPAKTCGCVVHAGCHSHHDKFSDILEQTGVPNLVLSTDMPPDFFWAGKLIVAYHKEQGTLFRIKSQTRWRVTTTCEYNIPGFAGCDGKTMVEGEIDRDYAGFEIVQFLARRLLYGWSVFHTYPVRKVSFWKGKGVEFNTDGVGLETVASSDIHKILADYELKYFDKPLPELDDEDIASMQSIN